MRPPSRFAASSPLFVVLLVAGCATAFPPADAPRVPTPEPMPLEGLDFAAAICVAEALEEEAVRTSRRAARAQHRARFHAAVHDQDEWAVRRRYVLHLQETAVAERVTLRSSSARDILWAQQVLHRDLRMHDRVFWADAAYPGLEQNLRANSWDRTQIIAGSSHAFIALSRAHRDVFEAAAALEAAAEVGADTSATVAALEEAGRALDALVEEDPTLEVVFQEEFELAYRFSPVCETPGSSSVDQGE